MLLTRLKYYAGYLILADAVGIVLVFLGTYTLRNSLVPTISPLAPLLPWNLYLPLLLFVAPVWIALLLWCKGYSLPLEEDFFLWAFKLSLKTTIGGLLALGAYLYVSRNILISRTFLGLCALGNGLVVFSIRAAFYLLFTKVGRSSHFAKNLLVVGTQAKSERVIQNVKDHAHWGLNLVKFIEIEGAEGGGAEESADSRFQEVLLQIRNLINIKKVIIDEIVVCLPSTQILKFEPIKEICSESGVRVSLFSDLFPAHNPHIQVTSLHGLGLITIDPSMGRELAYFFKRVIDLTIAPLLLLVLSPIMLVVGLAIKLTSKGPILFSQTRVGLNGRHFQMLKFRTMVEEADALHHQMEDLNVLDGPVFKSVNDPRLTPIGRILRRAFIDEIPQLIHVVTGEMSLVGPRPPLPSEVEEYKLWHSRRLSMKPGITGLWQVTGRAKFVSFEEWMRLDLDYIERWSLWLDMKILLKTVAEVLRCSGV